MDANISDRITAAKTCYFISPHYDDMVFSAGAFATELAKTHKVVVINIFTACGKSLTMSAKSYLKQCGYVDADKLYHERNIEDKAALHGLADEVIDLGITEALWRTKPGKISTLFGKLLPEFIAVYPTYRFHIAKGRTAKPDKALINHIEEKLKALISDEDAVVFCPAGIGNHIDHVITRNICTALFKHPIYWADYPYVLAENTVPLQAKEMFSFAKHKNEKKDRMRAYKTQYTTMIGRQGPDLTPERFYTT